jgi:hypothetical protein
LFRKTPKTNKDLHAWWGHGRDANVFLEPAGWPVAWRALCSNSEFAFFGGGVNGTVLMAGDILL